MPHQRTESGPHLLPSLLAALCVLALMPMLATATRTETIESDNYELRNLAEPSMRICLTLLDSAADFDAKLRLEVASTRDISTYLSCNTNVSMELLPVPGPSVLRYDYTSSDQEVGLKVTLNDKELPCTPYQTLSSDVYHFNLVKFYIKGHVNVTYDCLEDAATTTTKGSTVAPITTPRPTTTTATEAPEPMSPLSISLLVGGLVLLVGVVVVVSVVLWR